MPGFCQFLMDNVRITFIGHSTTLIESGGTALLTDPNFNSRVLFVRRTGPLKYDPAHLPPLTAVLVSHTHIDHFDTSSFNYIRTSVPVIIPEGSEPTVRKFLPNPIIELSSWSHHEISGVRIHAVPAAHKNSLAHPYFFKNAAGYIIEIGGRVIYFAGDTTYNTRFRDIGHAYSIDAALLPIGGYRPAFFMRRHHMDPFDAVQALIDLGAKVMIPIHWGSFRLSLEKVDEAVKRLTEAASERGVLDNIRIIENGGSMEV